MKYSANSVWENKDHYDVAVIGAGHAGCEAALACARMGFQTIVFTVSVDSIALMPCNPNIGGSSKGHLVREVDALGGEMGKVIDRTFIQSKMLNRSKGPAVHSLRAQADKNRYSAAMRQVLEDQENLEIKQAEVVKILTEDDRVTGVQIYSGMVIPCRGCDPVYRHLSPGPVRLRGCKYEHRAKWTPGGQSSDRMPEGSGDPDVSLQNRDAGQD